MKLENLTHTIDTNEIKGYRSDELYRICAKYQRIAGELGKYFIVITNDYVREEGEKKPTMQYNIGFSKGVKSLGLREFNVIKPLIYKKLSSLDNISTGYVHELVVRPTGSGDNPHAEPRDVFIRVRKLKSVSHEDMVDTLRDIIETTYNNI